MMPKLIKTIIDSKKVTSTFSNDHKALTVSFNKAWSIDLVRFYYVLNEPLSDQNTSISGFSDPYINDGINKPDPIVTYTPVQGDSRILTKDVDYTLLYSNNSGPGKATITVQGKGDYYGDQPFTFTIRNLALSDFDRNNDGSYRIASKEDLAKLAQLVNIAGNDCANATFRQEGPFTCDDTYTPIGTTTHAFCGTYDGGGNSVSGISASGANGNVGLFGVIGTGGTVKNVILGSSYFSGGSWVGGIAGRNNGGTIQNCYVQSTVAINSASNNAYDHGGIVGLNSGTIAGCLCAASVSVNERTGCQEYGGIAGASSGGTIKDCLYIGSAVSAASKKGAVVGTASNTTFTNNYYTTINLGGVNSNDVDGARRARTVTIGENLVLVGDETAYSLSGLTAVGTGNYALRSGSTLYSGEGQALTLRYTAGDVPAGKMPRFTISPSWLSVTDNGNGSYSITMPDYDTEISASAALYKDISHCTATVPDQLPNGNSLIMYKFENANYGNAFIGETVKDGETTLTLGTDYEFGSVTYANGNRDPYAVGDACRVEINGKGEYTGTQWATFTIVNPSGNGNWGDLSWRFANGTLNISLTNIEGGNKPMVATNRESYPWYQYASYITAITIGNGVTSIANDAFAGTPNMNNYGGVETVALPSTLTRIGDHAFAYCTGLSINLDNIPRQTTFGLNPFNQIKSITGTLEFNVDNTERIGLMAGAKTANVTVEIDFYNGCWGTLCLPFDVSDIADSPLQGLSSIKELDTEGYSDGFTRLTNTNGKYYYENGQEYTGSLEAFHRTGLSDETYYINIKEATSIEAGKPYLVYIEKGRTNIKRPTFNGVRVVSERTDAVSKDGKVKFVGDFAQRNLSTEGDVFVFDYYNATPMIPTTQTQINAFEAYIQLTDSRLIEGNGNGNINQFRLVGSRAPRILTLNGRLSDDMYWSTFYSGGDRFTLPEGAAAYTMDSSHQLYRLGDDGRTIPKNTAVIIIAVSGGVSLAYDLGTSEIDIHGGANILQGSTSPVTVSGLGGTPYVMSVVGTPAVLGFYQFTGTTIPANKAYYVQ